MSLGLLGLLPLLGATIADLVSLVAVFALAIAAAAIQLGLLPKLRTARDCARSSGLELAGEPEDEARLQWESRP